MKKIAFFGVGNMAGVIIKGLLNSGTSCSDIILYDKLKQQYDKFNGPFIRAESFDIINQAEIILLAVKPQDFENALLEIKQSLGNMNGKTLITIVAGKSIASVEEILGESAVIRVMPNALMSINHGVAELCRNSRVSDEVFDFALSMFKSSGYATEVKEKDINAYTALTSSSPAYVYLFVKSMVEATAELGVSHEDMTEMICRTVTGASEMLLKSGKTPDELISVVATHGGTTERAVNVLLENGFDKILIQAVKACSERAAELGAKK